MNVRQLIIKLKQIEDKESNLFYKTIVDGFDMFIFINDITFDLLSNEAIFTLEHEPIKTPLSHI